ncbi:xanthine dehydrogenase family protein molybdopterin-binding subunit [Sphingomonas naphthae]|uniref:Xanthine dehydrogenase family protein molybdopterin-binding subunit n=1 Tax=Sphingomonas naphthae TaxID=1813468 RepID=A0ABY7TPU1_9SPHN|nr:xanthine dehydrogenase family protein molybdopterin-binding subunit [Sphingomonas naphthae]WCT74652.1 xanthine dehydrogenase family protein molybdopterin-binding subunit [Sphingomonas naphthae]
MATMPDPPLAAPLGRDRLDAAPRRIEGRDKITGRLRYAGDISAATLGIAERALLHAVAIVSTQANGRVLGFDADEALAAPGVKLLMTHENAPRLGKVVALNGAEIGELRPLQDDVLHYGGQCVAVLVADTLQHALEASVLVRVRYSEATEDTAFRLADGRGRAVDAKSLGSGTPGKVETGDADAAYAQAPYKVDVTLTTSAHHHNAMEPGAAVAMWNGEDGLTVYSPTQFSYNEAVILGEAFGFSLKERLPRMIAQVIAKYQFSNKVRVVAPPAGGAFGGKNCNIHLLLVAMAAKLAGAPVKLVLSRAQTYTLMPHRGETHQRIRLAADADGQLQSFLREAVVAQGAKGSFAEPVNEVGPKSYACPNLRLHTQTARLDTSASGWMRGPGAGPDAVGLEIAMDMLAHEAGIDPLDFRLRNHADVEPDTGHEWSSKSLKACYQAAAERIGWFDRDPAVGSMREGRHLVGFGMTTSMYPVLQMPALARCVVRADGLATLQTAQHEIGQGMITSLTQLGAEALGLPVDQVTLEYGDSALPYGGMTVGSMTTLTNGAAIHEAATLVKKALLKRAVRDQGSPLHGLHRHDLDVVDGVIVSPDGPRETVAALMSRHPEGLIEEEAVTGRTMGRSSYGRFAFGAQFAKVLIDPETGHLQVAKLIGAFAGGRAVNPLLVRSQLMGGMVWGLGQALLEETVIDPRSGMWMNRSLGEALVPAHADIAELDALIIEEDDTRAHPLGIKGMGEIGSIGGPAAISNAIFHATGVRLTELPFRIDRLLAAMRSRS